MKITLVIFLVSIIAIIILFFILGVFSRSGIAPGLIDGKLSPCPDKPNCVCSDINTEKQHYIEPLNVSTGKEQESLILIKKIIKDSDGELQSENDNYAAYHFSSKIFGFVDDLEVRLDINTQLIHIRSASRVGYSDRGVNKDRVNSIKEIFKKKLSPAT